MQQIYHKKNELFEVHFYQDKECTEDFDFTNAKDLYIEFVNGDVSPLLVIRKCLQEGWYQGAHKNKPNIFIPYLPPYTFEFWYRRISSNIDPIKVYTISHIDSNTDITTINPNLSKYTPEDNAVLFLNEEDADKYANDCEAWFLYQKDFPERALNSEMDIRDYKKLTIFTAHCTQSELQKANEIAKELKEKYGVEEVNLFVLHCFVDIADCQNPYALGIYDKREGCREAVKKRCDCLRQLKQYNNPETESLWDELSKADEIEYQKMGYVNKIIATNSTGILPVQNTEHLQVIDCKEIFEAL